MVHLALQLSTIPTTSLTQLARQDASERYVISFYMVCYINIYVLGPPALVLIASSCLPSPLQQRR